MGSSIGRVSLVLLAILTSLATSAVGQVSPNTNTKTDWVLPEIEAMRANGLLVGYPKSLLGGNRSLSRIEFALATYAAWAKLIDSTDRVRGQIDALLADIEVSSTQEKLNHLRDAVSTMQIEISKLVEQMSVIKRLIDEFSFELSMVGAEPVEMKKAVNALDRRFVCYDNIKQPFDIHGSLNLVALNTFASSREGFGISIDGRPLGKGRDLTIFSEGDLELTTNNEVGPKFVAQLAIGNMFGRDRGLGDQGSPSHLVPFREGNAGWYAERFYVDTDTYLGELGLNAKVGRVGYKVNGMIFQRPDTSPYFKNDLWDDGNWTFDGAILGFRLNSASLKLFGGVTGSRFATNNIEFQRMLVGRQTAEFSPLGNTTNGLKVDQTLGAHLWLPLGDRGGINLAFLSLKGDAVSSIESEVSNQIKEAQVYGGEVSYALGGRFSINSGFAKSDLLSDSRREVTVNNQAWWANLKFGGTSDRPFVSVGYRSVDPLYGAPGAWNRVGTYWSPVDLEGWVAEGGLNLSQNLKLNAFGTLLAGRGTSESVLGRSDRAQTFRVGLDYWLGSGTSVFANIETNRWDFDGGGSPSQNWYTAGVSHSFGNSWNLKFLFQLSGSKADGDERFKLFGQEIARGGLIGTQLTLRY